MNNKVILSIVGVIAVALSFFIGTQVGSDSSSSESKKSETTTSTTMKSGSSTTMKAPERLELDENLPTPTATITVTKDMKSGYNLKIETTDFTFTPQNANTDKAVNPQNEGHSHLYVNGTKITRVYGNYFYMSADIAKTGDVVHINLNTDKHQDIVDSNKVTLD